MTEATDPIRVIEAAYRTDNGDRDWVAGLVEAARPLVDGGCGLFAGLYDARDLRRFRMRAMVGTGIAMRGWAPLLGAASRRVDPAHLRAVFRESTCATLSEAIGERFLEENALARQVARFGIHDSLGINGADPSGLGVILCVPQPRRASADPSTVALWSRVAAHLAAGLRLRRLAARGPSFSARSDEPLAGAEAVLDPAGRSLHAVGGAAGSESQAVLRAAAVAIDRARGRLRREHPDEAVAAWTALVAGRWTVVDHFDTDGRRFIIARRNDVAAPPCRPLTERERQVVAYVVMGHSNKLIAYEMGLAVSTVASHIASAAAKLGCSARVDLIRRFVESQAAEGAI